jgi:transcriptional regulator with XRE-family HTH domain
MTLLQILDKIRDERHLTITTFCEGICSRSNYSRYLNHEQKVSYDVLEKLSLKLGLSLMHVLRDYNNNNNNLKIQMNQLLMYVQNNDIDYIKKALDDIDLNDVIDSYYFQIYQYALYTYQYLLKNIDYHVYYEHLFEMVEYVYKQDTSEINSFEHIIMHGLADLELSNDDLSHQTIDLLIKLFTDSKRISISTENANFHLPTFALIGKYLIRKKDDDKATIIIDYAIKLSIQYDVSRTLDALYYMKGLLYLKDDRVDSAIHHYQRCLYTVLSKQDNNLFDYYKKIIKKDLSGYAYNESLIETIKY